MYRLMGQGWSQRRITVTCIKPENTSLTPKTFDVGTDDDLKEEVRSKKGEPALADSPFLSFINDAFQGKFNFRNQ